MSKEYIWIQFHVWSGFTKSLLVDISSRLLNQTWSAPKKTIYSNKITYTYYCILYVKQTRAKPGAALVSVKDGASSHKIDYVPQILETLNLKGYLNPIIG